MRFLFVVQLFATSILALSINDSLLKIQATLLPKICLMDYKFKDKAKNNHIVIDILYDDSEYKNAHSLKDKIESKYKDGIKSYTIKVRLINYKDSLDSKTNIFYLFPTNIQSIKKVTKKAFQIKALTFSYLEEDLEHGVMISLNIGNKTRPVLNLRAIKSNDITLRPILLKISKIYNDKDSNMVINKWILILTQSPLEH